MRFAWQRENSANNVSVNQGFTNPLNRMVFWIYNGVFWIVILLTFIKIIHYSTGFIAFTVIIIVRLGVNLYTNNVLELTPEQFENFPYRIP